MHPDSRLQAAIQEARKFGANLPRPENEANTGDWIIRPLLLAAGYANHEVFSQTTDVSGKFPDYTVLPNTDHTWYVEAKAFGTALDNRHVDQALNYAHQNGRRWVVLTNGRAWRLYDDAIPGTSSERLVAEADLQDETIVPFLSALSNDSVRKDGVAPFARVANLRRALEREIGKHNSPVIGAIVKVLKKDPRHASITAADVCRALAEIARPAASDPGQAIQEHATEAGREPEPFPSSGITVRLKAKRLHAVARFENPAMVLLPGCQLTKDTTPANRVWHSKTVAALMAQGLVEERVGWYEVIGEIRCGSPSGASDLVTGYAANGWHCWLDEDGAPINKYRQKSKG
jgi:hypothetical protein